MIDGNTAAEFEHSINEDDFDRIFGVEKVESEIDSAWDDHQAEQLGG